MSKIEYSQEYEDLEQYIEMEFVQLGGDMYECNGGHVWHESTIEEHFNGLESAK